MRPAPPRASPKGRVVTRRRFLPHVMPVCWPDGTVVGYYVWRNRPNRVKQWLGPFMAVADRRFL